MPKSSYNRIVIDLAAIRDNFRALQDLAGPAVEILAMVKSDAYGHGLIRCAKALASVGASYFGVAELDEAAALREAGIDGHIVIFLGCPDVQALIHYKLSPVVFDLESIREISAAAATVDTRIGLHLKIDVGMGRLGIMPADLPLFAGEISRLPGVFLAGVLGHFPMADQDELLTRQQNDKFNRLVNTLIDVAGGNGPVFVHIANSAALLQYPETHHQMVRPGISLYGCYPADDIAGISLRPVMSFKTQVMQIKDVPAGYGISYGHLFTTERPSRLAVLPVGYADGYLRALSGRASVLVRGRRVPVCGRICMNSCVIDVTDIPGVQVADEVVLLGKQNHAGISAAEVADWLHTINYEVLCLFGNNNDREYVD
ncbi:MAG: alanine racemase [Deltaproteobacteria bacterium]|nr:alanine racemase [Deltaproteobacteria bacterium]